MTNTSEYDTIKTKLTKGAFTSGLFLFYGLFLAAMAGATNGVWWTVGLSFPFLVVSVLLKESRVLGAETNNVHSVGVGVVPVGGVSAKR